MEGEEGVDPAAGDGRWTCDACFCHTNTNSQNPIACGICGTRRVPGFLRRAGRSAASRFLANHYNFAVGNMDDEAFEDGDVMEMREYEAMMGMDPEQRAVAALALEVAGIPVAARIPGARSVLNRLQRIPNAGPPAEDARNLSPPEQPDTLWRLAMENAALYQPKWVVQRGARSRHGHEIELGTGDLRNVARTADAVGEGRAIRASDPFPRGARRAQYNQSDASSQGGPMRKVFGFRVVFDHPYREPGNSLGDCYLVGVTTASFSAYGDRNGLLQSPHFWGIEDGGSQFEGARRRRVPLPPSAPYAVEMDPRAIARHSNVLFGARDTVSVVVDLDNRTLSFWREGEYLGTLVRNLPRSGHLYPVIVPFNAGVTFAITGMDGSPLSCIERFISTRREKEVEKANRRHQQLAQTHSLLFENGNLSNDLKLTLKELFNGYSKENEESAQWDQPLGIVAASRLWYRSGLSLSDLYSLVEEKVAQMPGSTAYDNIVSVDDFVQCIKDSVVDDIAGSWWVPENAPVTWEVGDKVELVESYSKFGDAVEGPLQLGDRGAVLEVKQGPNMEPYAVRVGYKSQEWWYDPLSLLPERSGLIESPAVWFLHRVLRSHGYDHNSLERLWGKPLSTSSWEVGDLVVPLNGSDGRDGATSADTECFGRIVVDTKDPWTSSPGRGRKPGSVCAEFAEPSFGIATGVLSATSESASSPSLQVRRVSIDKLKHATVWAGQSNFRKDQLMERKKPGSDFGCVDDRVAFREVEQGKSENTNVPNAEAFFVSHRMRADIDGVACLDPTAIQSVARACESQPSLSSGLFASGLSDAILSGVSLAEHGIVQGKTNDSIRAGLSSLGLLSGILCQRLLSSAAGGGEERMEGTMDTTEEDQDTSLSLVIADAMRSDDRELEFVADEDPPPALARRELIDTRRLISAAAQHRGHTMRTRARHVNSTRSMNVDGRAQADARTVINNALMMNSLSWAKAFLSSSKDRANRSSASESLSSAILNIRDQNGMSLLLLSVALGCSRELVKYLILSGAVVSEAEVKVAALTNQPHLLSVLLHHTDCSWKSIESLQVSPDVSAEFRVAEARQKAQEQLMRRKADTFASSFILRLCRLIHTCRSGPIRTRNVGGAACEALVGNVLLRAVQESQQKALAASSPRRRKHGGVADPMVDAEGERFSLFDPFGIDRSEVIVSTAALSRKHGILLVLPSNFLCDTFLSGSTKIRNDRLKSLMSALEALLWNKDKEDVAVGLFILHSLLTNVQLHDISSELGRYGVSDLTATHEVLAGRHLEDLKRWQNTSVALETSTDSTSGENRSNKKRPRPHLAMNTSNTSAEVLCPKSHVAELHLTKHSSFRCDICGKGVLRDRPMHGCRECDWDACASCTDKAQGGVIKWTYILDLAESCRKLLGEWDGTLKSSHGLNQMKIGEPLVDSKSCGVHSDLSGLARRLRTRDVSVLVDLASNMTAHDQMTNHEFVSHILPALHSALVGKDEEATRKSQFCVKALEALATFCENPTKRHVSESHGDDDMSIEEVPSHEDDESLAGFPRRQEKADAVVLSGAIRRLQDILSFAETLGVLDAASGGCINRKGSGLESLTRPIELLMSPMNACGPVCQSTVFVEPLLPIKELQRHVIRTCRLNEPSYLSFCRSLAEGEAVIVERPLPKGPEVAAPWQVAQVIAYDEDTGLHAIRYSFKLLEDFEHCDIPIEAIKFDGEKVKVVLAAREYYILRRSGHKSPSARIEKTASSSSQSAEEDCNAPVFPPDAIPVGARVEANCMSPENSWLPCAVRSRCVSRSGVRYDVVSDYGEVFQDIRDSSIRGNHRAQSSDSGHGEPRRNLRDALDPEPPRNPSRRNVALPFPFFRMGRPSLDERFGFEHSMVTSSIPEAAVLKRSWSALSPISDMCPIDIALESDTQIPRKAESGPPIHAKIWKCSISGTECDISSKGTSLECPPKLCVEFSAHQTLPTIDVSTFNEKPVFQMLRLLLLRHADTKTEGYQLNNKPELFYSIRSEYCLASTASFGQESQSPSTPASWASSATPGYASASLPSTEPDSVADGVDPNAQDIYDVLNDTALQCMEVLNVLASCAEERSQISREERAILGSSQTRQDDANHALYIFENEMLSQKLCDQLEDPLMVVGGVLPEWCLVAPSVAPSVFSLSARRQLLQRTAFGVSRSAFKQQESKVAVGPLRQRMAVLRGRAVELMGEAFSGEAEDPTVLQLQADELYGMEEALASRVSAAFRAQRWDERSLQCVKAVVRRDMLLPDAGNLMDRYASDGRLCHRRLEVRFEGESGFDAAAGTEAGVTRGFYADVAESLLSCEHVATLYCPATCVDEMSVSPDSVLSNIQCRLPLWIPDVDSSRQVVIPTPRASPSSTLGVFPRPLSSNDPFLPLVRERFRFMGRLFAAAMRDNLMFPLQLSAAFLKLVQIPAVDGFQSKTAARLPLEGKQPACGTQAMTLTSDDLPRPGFLGGEVYAVETYVCAALDSIDKANPPLSPFEADAQRQKIASDPQFARVALGKTYDCSFNEYFEDRTLVDPLSPTQGEDAVPLCPDGHLRQVNIHNVREWVHLAKNFMLYDGVIDQALAFKRGVDDFFPSEYLRIFTANELQRDVCGGGDKVERWTEEDIKALFKFDGGRGVTEALVAVAGIGGTGGASMSRRFGPSSPTIGFLVKTLLESTPTQRRQFLSFVTSVPIVTPGKIEVAPVVSPSGEFMPMRDPGCLPRANTCARRLYLPRFDNYETFSQVLQAVIREESKFKGFYEWRG